MDFEFGANRLLIELSSQEISEFVAKIPDDVLRAEVLRRNLEIFAGSSATEQAHISELSDGIGAVTVKHTVEPTTTEVGTDYEVDTDIRRPILKYEFMRYVDSRLVEGEKRKIQAQKGVIGRTWNGFIGLHKTSNDFGHKIDQAMAERTTGVKIPAFEDVIYDKSSVHGNPKYYVNEDLTNGLDLDQAARYLLAIYKKIRERHIDGQPLDKVLSADVIKRCLPTYSFVGCQLLCEYIAITAEQEGGLPEDISTEALKQASNDFAELARETSKKVFLKVESVFAPEQLEDSISIDDFRSVYNSRGAGAIYWDLYRKVKEGRIPGLRVATKEEIDTSSQPEDPPRIFGDIKEVVGWLWRHSEQNKAMVIEKLLEKREDQINR